MASTDGALQELMVFTGLDVQEATVLLDAAGGDLASAVSLHFEQEEQTTAAAAAAATADGEPNFEGLMEDGEEEEDLPPPAPPADENRGGMFSYLARGLGIMFRYASTLPGLHTLSWVAVQLGRALVRSGLPGVVGLLLRLIFVTPLSLLGLMPPPRTARTLRQFEASFEEEFGSTHPPFFNGSCTQALQRAKREAKFLLVYCHDERGANTKTFCRRLLSSELFCSLVAEQLVFWVADSLSAEGRAVSRALRIRESPALVLLAHADMAPDGAQGGGGGGGAQALGVIGGSALLEEGSAVEALSLMLERYEPLLVAARAEAHERQVDRMIRSQQEAEYERALQEDREREAAEAAAAAVEEEEAAAAAAAAAAEEEEVLRAEAAAAEEAAAEVARGQRRRAKGALLPPEPQAGGVHVLVRLPEGGRLSRRFEASAPLQQVVDWIESSVPEIYEFDLVSNFPRKEFGMEQRQLSLEALGCEGSIMLFTKEQ